MKTKFNLLCFLLLLILAARAQSPQGCGMHIIPNPESNCLIEDYLERYPNMAEPGTGDCLLTCGGDTVTYTAVCSGAVRYSWSVFGADTTIASGYTAKVFWGNEQTGHVSVTAVLSDSSLCTAEACILIIEPPKAAFTSVPAWHYDSAGKKVIEVCIGQTIWLYDRSETGHTPITGYYWESCFGSASTQNHSISPDAGSEYVITHCVTNECGCQDCEFITLRVLDTAPLELSCHGTVCQNTTASYSLLMPDCSIYHWNVEGGVLVGQGSPDITVHWGAPPSGYGIISLDTRTCDTGCVSLRSTRIPVIVDDAEILGPETACVGEIQQYELPFWGSTLYLWGTSPDTTGGFLERSADYPNKYLIEFSRPGTYTIEAEFGLGFDRTLTGSANVKQYPEELCRQYNDINTCPENLLAWFHHVPWDHKMKSGRTFWDELCHKYDDGVQQARRFLTVWDAMQPYVDCQRFDEVQRKLRIQARDAEWWRDACLLYFQTFSHRPIPQDVEHPVHNLDEMMQFRIPISMYENPENGYTK